MGCPGHSKYPGDIGPPEREVVAKEAVWLLEAEDIGGGDLDEGGV